MVFATPFATPKMNLKDHHFDNYFFQYNSLRLVDTTEVTCYNTSIRKGRFDPLRSDFFLVQKTVNITGNGAQFSYL